MHVTRLAQAALLFGALAGTCLAMPLDSFHRHRHKPAVVRPVETDFATPSTASMVGTWVVDDPNGSYRDVKAVFRPDGSFRFVGGGWTSTGSYCVENHRLRLRWDAIDGEPVEPGSVAKDFGIDDPRSFRIDNYHYCKLRE